MKIYEYTESLSPVFSAKINIYFKNFRAAKTIAKQESEENKNSQMIYSINFITGMYISLILYCPLFCTLFSREKTFFLYFSEMFIQLAHTSPIITLQWCYILKLMKFTPQSMWSKILQPEQKTLDIIKPYALDSESLNYEILRKGGLILLCDSLCENIGNVESTTWLIVNYTQNIVQCINESPVQGKF